jgi:anti-anti-sigma factor
MALLAEHGAAIVIVELEGAMFFGTAEQLVAHVDKELERPTMVLILDFRRVTEVDITGARILTQLAERVSRKGALLALSSLSGPAQIGRTLLDMGVIEALGIERSFPDRDHALEWAEDHVIAQTGGAPAFPYEIPVEALDLFRHLTEAERESILKRMERREYKAGQVLAREGEPGSELFVILRGAATGRIRTDSGRDARLTSFAAGTVAGELALLDEENRSATIVADKDLACMVLRQDAFAEMMRDEPGVAVKLLANLAREISWRLRRANRMISEFD